MNKLSKKRDAQDKIHKFREFVFGENRQNDIVEIHIMSLKVATLQLIECMNFYS